MSNIYPDYDSGDEAACRRKLEVCAKLRDICWNRWNAPGLQPLKYYIWGLSWEHEREEAENALLTFHTLYERNVPQLTQILRRMK